MLTADDEHELFSLIEKGLALYPEDGNLDSLSPEQEKAFIDLAGAYKVVYSTNLRLVTKIAIKYRNINLLPMLDMIQEGNVGLSKAITRFDINRGFKFSTFATWWIRQSIGQALADTGRTIRIPGRQHDDWLRLGRKTQLLQQRLGREPSTEEIAAEMGITPEEVEVLEFIGEPNLTSLNTKIDETDAELGELIEGGDLSEAIDLISDKQELARLIAEKVTDQRKQLILSLRYWVYIASLQGVMVSTPEGDKPYETVFEENPGGLTMDEIGVFIGVTRERVRQILGKTMESLRK